MTTKLTKASKPHKHSWKVTFDSKPVSETDYHLMFIECDCGIKITVTNSLVAVYRKEDYLGGVSYVQS